MDEKTIEHFEAACRLALEERRAAQELRLKEAELELRNRELGLKEKELLEARWRNPIFLAIVAATISLLSNVVVTYLQSRQTQAIERSRSQSNLILEAIKTGDPRKAATNLAFFKDLGFLDVPDQKLAKYLANPEDIPVLPSPSPYPEDSGTFKVVDKETLQPIVGAHVTIP